MLDSREKKRAGLTSATRMACTVGTMNTPFSPLRPMTSSWSARTAMYLNPCSVIPPAISTSDGESGSKQVDAEGRDDRFVLDRERDYAEKREYWKERVKDNDQLRFIGNLHSEMWWTYHELSPGPGRRSL